MSVGGGADLTTLDLELLRAFVEVARQGTFQAAGASLGRTQSAVTQQMQRLEALAGKPLFQREGRAKHLTEHGRHLLRYAREMLSLNDDAVLFLRDRSPRGSLRIGSPHDVADTLLTQILGQLARLMPNLNLEISIGRSPQLLDGLHSAELDLTLATREDPALDGVAVRTSPILWLCSTQFQHLPGQPLPLILGDEPSIFRRVGLEALERAGLPWRQVYLSASPIGVKAAVRAGLGITPRSVELLSADMRALGEKDGLPRLPDVTYYLYMRPNALNPVVRQAYALLRSAMGPQGAP